jgi:methionyl-tRNA synthetase
MEIIMSTIYHTPWLIALIVIWSIAWKAIATWHAARNSQLGWFIALFIINTVGMLEIIYLLFFRKKTIIT